MNHHLKTHLALLLATLVFLFNLVTATAQTANPYVLTAGAVTSGGGGAGGGSYLLGGSVGQPGAGVVSGGSYTLIVGISPGASENRVFLPLVRR
jgi:uncharacterized membrane protein